MSPPPPRIEPWGPGDLDLLQRLTGDPAMMEHLGGPEHPDRILERQARYEQSGDGQMFKIIDATSGEAVGSVGYWMKDWHGEVVYEIGWSVLPAFQGRGLASAATRLAIHAARAERRHSALHAFPSITNPASNAICQKLGFTLVEELIQFEYPKGNYLTCNDWRLELEFG